MSAPGEDPDSVVDGASSASSRATSQEPTPTIVPQPHASNTEGSERRNSCQSCAKTRVRGNKAQRGKSTLTTVTPPRAGDTAGSRLRNSCRSCANSKVKCNKGKPTCSRCEARGIECQYLQSKRPGRVPGSGTRLSQPNRTNDLPKSSTRKSNQAGTSANNGMIPAFLPFPSSSALGMDCTSNSSRYRADSLFSAPGTASDAGFFTATAGMDGDQTAHFDLDDMVDRVESLGVLSTVDDMMYTSLMDCDTDLANLDSWKLFDDGGSDYEAGVDGCTQLTNDLVSPLASHAPASAGLTEPNSLVSSSLSSATNLVDLPNSTASSLVFSSDRTQPMFAQPDVLGESRPESNATSTCDCMVQALDLLKTHSNARSPDVLSSSGKSFTQRVLAENKQDIEANLAMLACDSCSNDKFLLMILLMITTKILARYASAAALCGTQTTSTGSDDSHPLHMASTMHREGRATSTSDHAERLVEMSRAWGGNAILLPTPAGGPDEQLSSREAIQRVLRELHRVQRLISQLSIRRKSLGSPETSAGSTAGLFAAPIIQIRDSNNTNRTATNGYASLNSTTGIAATTPLSARTLDLVEGDVRSSLSALSAVVRGVLRNS